MTGKQVFGRHKSPSINDFVQKQQRPGCTCQPRYVYNGVAKLVATTSMELYATTSMELYAHITSGRTVAASKQWKQTVQKCVGLLAWILQVV